MLSNKSLVILSLATASMAWPWGRSGKWSNKQRTTCHGAEALLTYTTVTGFFLQDDNSTNPSGFDYVSGLEIRALLEMTRENHKLTSM